MTESNAAAEENCLKCADGQAQLRRYTDFLGSMYGKEWMLDRRQRMATELPPGFSQQDFDRIEAFKAAESERQQAAMQMQSVLSQLAVLEEVHPVLRDLRAFASEPEAMVTA